MQLSIVIPLLNECFSILELYQWITRVVKKNFNSYEIIFIDDGSTDNSWYEITSISKTDSNVKAIRFLTNFGKSQALHAGFSLAKGNVVITMDADLQDSPEEIPKLHEAISKNKYHLICGWKKTRYDSLILKNIPSKVFNWMVRKISKMNLHDFNCGLKGYSKTVVKNIEIKGEMHRLIPILVKDEGFNKIGEIVVKHQARKYGKTKFGNSRFIKGFLDILTIWFLTKFQKNPMHLFGFLGLSLFFIGFCSTLYLGIDKLFISPKSRLITEIPFFYISLTCMVLGTVLFMTGFLAEIILSKKEGKLYYKISETI